MCLLNEQQVLAALGLRSWDEMDSHAYVLYLSLTPTLTDELLSQMILEHPGQTFLAVAAIQDLICLYRKTFSFKPYAFERILSALECMSRRMTDIGLKPHLTQRDVRWIADSQSLIAGLREMVDQPSYLLLSHYLFRLVNGCAALGANLYLANFRISCSLRNRIHTIWQTSHS